MSGDRSGEDLRREEASDERLELARRRTELADARTVDASRRTVLANERTFSAWLRTALSAIGVGLAVPRLLAPEQHRVTAMWLGLMMILVGLGMVVLAEHRYRRVAKNLEEAGLHMTPGWVATAVLVAMLLVVALAVVLVLSS